MKLLPESKIAYLTKKLNACVGIISKLLISPPRHGRYWAVKPIALPGDNSPQKNSCKGNFTLGARGFSCAVSGFAARVFCQRPKTCRPAADEAPRHTGEKTSGTQGRETCLKKKILRRVIRKTNSCRGSDMHSIYGY